MRIVVALSGGVDSAVAAALLQREGHEVIGMMMRLWAEPPQEGAGHNRCCTPAQMDDARRIAGRLDIPFYVLDTRDVFRRRIVDFFIEGHRRGVTPNPCIECNRHIRFDWLQRQSLALDADCLATGHYARIRRDAQGRYRLLRARDHRKDQSYVLSVMGQEQLARARFPTGDYHKTEVRQIAEELQLLPAPREESQDLCFLGDGDYRRFLRAHAPQLMRAGPILDHAGRVLGQHRGLANYTVGQRRGLGLSAARPLYVTAMRPADNTLLVGEREELGVRELTAARVNWVSGVAPRASFDAEVCIRYHGRSLPATVTPLGEERMRVRFSVPAVGPGAGQGAVIYDGEESLGGGIIEPSVEDLTPTQALDEPTRVRGSGNRRRGWQETQRGPEQ